ncbi:MAG: hypothetical protein K0Q73_4149 [Paenibacillus sp.]|jgi:hypothetical protein|nr:hypothetical protein [Paenibacillus sp.]
MLIKNKNFQIDDVIVQESGYILSDMDRETEGQVECEEQVLSYLENLMDEGLIRKQ